MNINETIFRAYDIRGIYEEQITDETAYILGKSFGSYVKLFNQNEVLVGYDNRFSSPSLANNLIKGLLESGVDVTNLGLVTTPMYYYARYKLNKWAAIMITASHNPSNHNGFKISFNELGNALGDEIIRFKEFTLKGEFDSGNGTLVEYNIEDEYINLIVNSLKIGNKKIKAIFDAGNGTVSVIIKKILEKLNITYDLLYCDSDPSFPNHHPDPSISSNLVDLQKRVIEMNYDIGIAMDADGDRVRIIDNKGNIINSDIYMIIMYRYLNSEIKNRKALYDVKCSKALIDELNKLELNHIMYKTGNSYMYRKMHEENIYFAGEYSGHMWFNDRFYGFDDGLYAGLRMIEILSNTNKTMEELCENINVYYSTDEFRIDTTEENKNIVVEKVKEYAKEKGYKYNDIDGVRIEFDYGWALIRQSNTGAIVSARFEANNEILLNKLHDEFMTIINLYK